MHTGDDGKEKGRKGDSCLFPLSIVHCTLTISQLLLSLLEYPAEVSVEEREPNSLYMKGRVIKKMRCRADCPLPSLPQHLT